MKVADRVTIAALATFFVVVQFYTSLAALAPTPAVGYVFATRPVAAALVALLGLSAVICAWRLWSDRAPMPPASRALLIAWIGSALVASLLGLDPSSGLQVVGMMLLAGAFHLGFVRYHSLPGAARALFGAYLWAGLAAVVAALVMFASRMPAELFALNHGRAAGVFVTPNQFAAFLILFLFIALGVALSASGGLRVTAAAGTLAALVALGTTFSQAGLLGAAAGAVFFSFASGARRLAAGLAVALVLAAVAVALRPVAGHERADTFDRLRTWRAGARVAELFPLTGAGPMAYWRVYPAVRPANGDLPGTFGALHPHDAYLSLAGETGLVGLAALVYGWWRIAVALRAALARRPPRERLLALGICAGLCATLVQGIFDTIGIVAMCFVWIPFTALALASAQSSWPARGTS
jgi:O-antigen ligase